MGSSTDKGDVRDLERLVMGELYRDRRGESSAEAGNGDHKRQLIKEFYRDR